MISKNGSEPCECVTVFYTRNIKNYPVFYKALLSNSLPSECWFFIQKLIIIDSHQQKFFLEVSIL